MPELRASEPAIRLGCFVGMLLAMSTWEVLAPRRPLVARKPWRWASNLGLIVLSTLALRIAAPLGAVGVALWNEQRGWGLLHTVEWPAWAELATAVVLLDLAIYLQHVLFHAVPLFWRLHLVHHADLDLDVTTGLRFHTLEILLSLAIKAGVILLLGVSPAAVLIFEVLLNATSMFNHSNIRLPPAIDRLLRLILVTPDMHRVHHSIQVCETNSNYGFNLPWWDYLLGTYRSQPLDGHLGMKLGLAQLRDETQADRLHHMLWLPFASDLVTRQSGSDLRPTQPPPT